MVFTGKALYDTGVFNTVAEDVSPLIGMISPSETLLLDALSPPETPATNVLHEWLDEELSPNTLTASTALGSTTAVSSLEFHDGSGNAVVGFLDVGNLVYADSSGEYMVVNAVSVANNTLDLLRAQAGTTATSQAAGATYRVLGEAALEGDDVDNDTSRPRNRRTNYCQIFKKDIIISGTVQAVTHIGVSSELDHQVMKKTREVLRDLEKTVILGKTLGNTLGSSTARRSMDGLLARITTNVTSTATLTPDILNDIIKTAWDQGGVDNDLIVASPDWKRLIDQFGETRRDMTNSESTYAQRISVFDSTYGALRVMAPNRWMPAATLMVLSTERIKVVPLQGRSFQLSEVSRTGDSEKRMLLGEYTLQIQNQEGMAQASA